MVEEAVSFTSFDWDYHRQGLLRDFNVEKIELNP